MPTREDPRLTLRLSAALDGRLDGAARGAGVKKGTLARRAIELGMDAAIEEARGADLERDLVVAHRAVRRGAGRPAGVEVDVSPAARGERPAGVVAGREVRLDELVASRMGGEMMRARRAINAGLVTVGGRVVRDPMLRVPAVAKVAVDA